MHFLIQVRVFSSDVIINYKYNNIFSRYVRTSHTTNIGVLQNIGVKETTMINNLKTRQMSYAGHIMRNTAWHYDTVLRTIEGIL